MVKKNNFIVKVFIDSREQKMGKKAALFFKNQGIITEQKELINGDLVIICKDLDEPIYIERKTLSDFVGSYFTNHIQDQAIRLSEKKYRACVVYGDIFSVRRISTFRKVTQSSINKMITNLTLFYGLPIFQVNNENEYFKFCLDFASSIYKNKNKDVNLDKINAKIKDRPDISILTSTDNIGKKKAELLLSEFGSPKDVIYASREDLLKIKGIGDSAVADIKKLRSVFEGDVD